MISGSSELSAEGQLLLRQTQTKSSTNSYQGLGGTTSCGFIYHIKDSCKQSILKTCVVSYNSFGPLGAQFTSV